MAEERQKDPLAVELGRRGGLKGGHARKRNLTPEQLHELAMKGVEAKRRKAAERRKLESEAKMKDNAAGPKGTPVKKQSP
jgi:hypothetical protein